MTSKHVTILKLIIKITIVLTTLMLFSCGKTTYENNINGFVEIENDLKKKFGNNAFYTDITIELNGKNVTQIEVTQTQDPDLLKMQGWKHQKNTWKQFSEVNLELKTGEIKDYMFQLGNEINLTKVNQIKENIPLKEPFYLSKVKIISPNNGDTSKLQYQVQVRKKATDKKLKFNFDKDGYLIYQDNTVIANY